MKAFADLFPVLLFFVAYKFAGIYAATGIAIAATVGQIVWSWFKHRKVETMQWISLVIVGVFGGATLVLQNPTFIMWKPTVLYWFFAASLLGAQIQLPDAIWPRLNLAWAGFFSVMGGINLFVAYHFSEETWVNFKLFGVMGLMFVFVLAQGALLSRHIQEESK